MPGAAPVSTAALALTEVAADDPRVRAGRFNTGPTQWPAGLPGFRTTLSAYFDAAHALGATLVRGLGPTLALSPGHFDAYLDDAAATLPGAGGGAALPARHRRGAPA